MGVEVEVTISMEDVEVVASVERVETSMLLVVESTTFSPLRPLSVFAGSTEVVVPVPVSVGSAPPVLVETISEVVLLPPPMPMLTPRSTPVGSVSNVDSVSVCFVSFVCPVLLPSC